MSNTPMPIAVIGAGPAGLMAAEVLSAAGISVHVFDAMPSVGRKFLLAGIGGLNLTHAEPFDVFTTRFGERATACANWLQGFDAQEIANTPFGRGEQSNVTALATWIAAESKGMKLNLPQDHMEERKMYEVGKRLFFMRGGSHDFACATCHSQDDKRIRLQDLPNITKNPGAGNGFGAWPAYRVSNGQMWGAQLRLNDCYRQQRFPYPIFGSDATIALGVYMGVNGKGGATVAPAIKR